MQRFSILISIALFLATIIQCQISAANLPPFSTTKVMNGSYMLGVTSLAEFDQYNLSYPGLATALNFTFYTNGTVQVFDDMGGAMMGTYTRTTSTKIIVTVPVNSPYVNTMQIQLNKGVGNNWSGEIRWNNVLQGVLRAQM